MNKKRILIISRAFHPMLSPRSFRTTELVKELCRQGHEVNLLTYYKPKEHDALIDEFGFKILDLGSRQWKNIPSTSNLPKFLIRIVNRLLMLLFEYPGIEIMFQVKRFLKKMPEQYDLLISIAVPHPIHWGVAWAKTKSKPIAGIWIADCGDPYMGNTMDSFKKLFYFQYFEKWFCRKANFIAIPRINMKENFYPQFHDKFIEIPQGFKFEDSKKHLLPYVKNPIPTFAFSGSFIEGHRDPRPLLDYLISTKQTFKFFIFTKTITLIKPYLEKANGNIVLKDYIPREELLGFLSKMDFLVNIGYNPINQLPSKLIDYYLCDRPILNIEESSIIDKSLIDQFINGIYDQQLKNTNINQYKIENVCEKFLSLA